MDGFKTQRLGQGIYRFLDQDEDSFYLVEGRDQAAVIDTGITPGVRITPLLQEVTQKPLILLLTHAHVDHMHHMDEFETVYLCHDDLTMPEACLREHMAGKTLNLAGTKPIRTNDRIDLGGRTLEVCIVPGHTPGSAVFYDAVDELLFTGDAIGSGCGVFLQLAGCTSLAQYEDSLRHLMAWLVTRGGRMRFLGGHSTQESKSQQIPGFNPFSMGLLADLIDLTSQVVLQERVGKIIDLPADLRVREARYAAYGRAELLYNPDYIKGTENSANM